MSVSIANLYEDLSQTISALRADASSVEKSRAVVTDVLGSGGKFYGINTGFGALADTVIEPSQVEQLQRNLIISHAVGVGEPIPKEVARIMLQLKIAALGRGCSGISQTAFERLLTFAEKDLVPVIPKKGSVGASGDLAPLSHMVLPLIGRGLIWDDAGEKHLEAAVVLEEHKLEPITLEAKDGLSLVNGTEMMCAYASQILHRSLSLVKLADIIGAMTLEGMQGFEDAFDERIHLARPYSSQLAVAENMRKLIADSEIRSAPLAAQKVQDPYSLRCIPQVHGASRGALGHCVSVVETELNSVTDNPLVFEGGDILSGGNFHGQPLALALDYAAIALAELANISERRTYLLLEGKRGLPRLLMQDTGVNSGFMITQYTAAALVSENKVLCHPASVDSIPTGLGQEDHVSMGSVGAIKLFKVIRNLERVLGIELLTAAQAVDFRKPHRAGTGVAAAHDFVRELVDHANIDRFFKNDMSDCVSLVRNGKLIEHVEKAVGELH